MLKSKTPLLYIRSYLHTSTLVKLQPYVLLYVVPAGLVD